MDINEIWKNVLGELEVSISKPNFETWFRNTFLIDYKKGYFTIGVPTIFIEDWLKKKHLKEIHQALQKQVDDQVLGIKFKIAAPTAEQKISLDKNKVIHKPVDNSPIQSGPALAQSFPKNITLNDDYKFANFIVGASNQLAHAASLAVASKPGTMYNPLYIYGNSGLGKTHLMQAIGHAYLEGNPGKNVLYVTSETFINEFINAVEAGHGKAKDFKDRYRNVDLLLIDDIQFLSNKESTQEEFFHTFNHLHQNKKQVVLTSDRPPKDIKGLEIRLKTRFEGGMVADISMPDFETRVAILKQKAKKFNVIFDEEKSDEILHYIAENVQSSIRELEGALTKIVATCELEGSTINKDRVASILSGIIQKKKQVITPELILREVHKFYQIPLEDLLGRKRTKEIVVPRQITMYLLRHEANMSYPEIGKKMGGKDHSTIIHGCEKIEAEVAESQKVKEDLAVLKERIYVTIR